MSADQQSVQSSSSKETELTADGSSLKADDKEDGELSDPEQVKSTINTCDEGDGDNSILLDEVKERGSFEEILSHVNKVVAENATSWSQIQTDDDDVVLSLSAEGEEDLFRGAGDNAILLNENESINISDDESNNNPGFSKKNCSEILVSVSPDLTLDDVVDLSGDEEVDGESAGAEVSLLCLKRPPPVTSAIECVDILDSDEEFPVCVKPPEKVDFVNIEEKSAYVKEYIENEGLGVLHSDEHGLVLFHLSSVWVRGEKMDLRSAKSSLPIGTSVFYYERAFEGPEYKILCKEEVICQAVAVWSGERPKHLLRTINEFCQADWSRLEENRRTFLLYIQGEVFTPVPFVRVRGRVQGYLSQDIGLVEIQDENRKVHSVFFTKDDVRVYRKSANELDQYTLQRMLPVGLFVYVDARRCHISLDCDIRYEAICVFAGSWPIVPHPTLLPGGPGSYAPKFNIPTRDRHTFYYLELALESQLQKKVNLLKRHLEERGGLRLDWNGVCVTNNKFDVDRWKSVFDPLHGRRTRPPNTRKNWDKMEVTHTFKAPLIRHFKTKQELDDGSEVGNMGSRPASISGSSFGSRALSRMSDYSNQSDTSLSSSGKKRTWYNPEMYKFGGLRIKKEIKEELDQDSLTYQPPPAKRFKTEL